MGSRVKYDSLDKVRAEISRMVPMYADLASGKNTAWVKVSSGKKLFDPQGQGEPMAFSPVVFVEETPADDSFPYTAILGSVRFHLGGGTRTGLSDRIREFTTEGDMEVSMQDSQELDLQKGDRVRITSAHGAIERKVTLTDSLIAGQVFIPEAVNDNDAGNLIGLMPLDGNGSPGWKTCRVTLEKI
ncbi:MAG: hypothetical protein JRD68_03985 [Deltaproteobacteria bacterium]|nr:hypothetical protein [Deltaproteobacteria bacterium]